MDEEVLGVYGAPDSDFCAPNMSSSYLRLTDSAATTAESHFHPRPCPGMYSVGTVLSSPSISEELDMKKNSKSQ